MIKYWWPSVLAFSLAALPGADARPDVPLLVATLMLGLALSLLSAIDLATLRLPDALTLPLIPLGIAVSHWLLAGDWIVSTLVALGGFALLFALAEIFYRWRGVSALGLGDAKLFAASGAWVGMDGMASVLLIASGLALFIALLAPLFGIAVDRHTRIPFGPFLAGATWLVWLYGPLITG